jgi:hypothetical protein
MDFRRGACLGVVLTLGGAGYGCLARPVGKQPPTTKVNFTASLPQQAVDKVDILFAIDNSASMGDKQAILAEAVPDLINGLIAPNCVDSCGVPDPSGARASPTGTEENRFGCPVGTEPEFKPVTDMHIGIVSSSLGNFGGDVCANDKPRTNDKGHLLDIRPTDKGGGSVPAASPKGFLAWFPQTKDNEDEKRHPPPDKPIRTVDGPEGLTESFKDLVVGVGQTGCGLEAQLESVYRFLVQPDPWAQVIRTAGDLADLEGYDTELLRQRAEFLRPDSLVAVIMLTDEDDSSADPLAVGGQGWAFMSKRFPSSKIFRANSGSDPSTTAPRGTSICATDPGRKDAEGRDLCTSCAFANCKTDDAYCQGLKSDENCRTSGKPGEQGEGFDGYYGAEDDDLNVRFHRMKERYGIDPQYPIRRYVEGFSKFRVPDRKTEHPTTVGADGLRNIAGYQGTPKCTNPLFAAKLPSKPDDELCDLPLGPRSPERVLFAVVGGVPNQLLHFTPGNPQKSAITEADWVKILGKDPAKYDFTGIDPHMIQSVAPREGLGGADRPRGDNGEDPAHGREWNTQKSDLQYACTFALSDEQVRTCAAGDPSCDCAPDSDPARAQNPPLCNGNDQVRAKAYPTVRELQVVRELGDQGIVSSLCPIQLKRPNEPDYGYRPAVASIIDRLKNGLTAQCLPQRLRPRGGKCTDDASCASTDTCIAGFCETKVPARVDCLVLAQLSAESGSKCEDFGLAPPEAEIAKVFREEQRRTLGASGVDPKTDPASLPLCEVPQHLVPRGEDCAKDDAIHWCYVEKNVGAGAAGRCAGSSGASCPQSVIFSKGTGALVNARFHLQCINQFSASDGD